MQLFVKTNVSKLKSQMQNVDLEMHDVMNVKCVHTLGN